MSNNESSETTLLSCTICSKTFESALLLAKHVSDSHNETHQLDGSQELDVSRKLIFMQKALCLIPPDLLKEKIKNVIKH